MNFDVHNVTALIRFVRFVSTPEILERVDTIESEILQIDEAINIQGNENLYLNPVSARKTLLLHIRIQEFIELKTFLEVGWLFNLNPKNNDIIPAAYIPVFVFLAD